MQEGGVAKLLELGEEATRGSTHRINHLLAQTNGGRHWFGITTEDISEINVKEFACNKH